MRRDGALWIALTTVATARSGPVLTQGQSGHSILMDGRLVDADGVRLGTSDVAVEITLTDRRAALTGTIRDTRGQLRPDARVVVFGRDPASEEGCLRLIAPNRFGVFENSVPSRECLYAAVNSPPRAWYTPDYIETLVPFAVPARVELGQTPTIDLTVRP